MGYKPPLYHEDDLFDVTMYHCPECRHGEEIHETVQIVIPFEGAQYEVERSSETGAGLGHLLGAGDVLVVPKGQPHAIHWQRPASILSLQLSTDFFQQVLDKPRVELRDTLVLRDRFLSDAAIELRGAAKVGDIPSTLLGAFVAMIAYKVGRRAENADAKLTSSVRPLSAGERTRIVQFIMHNLDRPIRITELAQLVGMSQWHFLRRFTVTEGMSPNSFITKCKIDKACALLSQSTLSVTDIALETGMSHSQLSRVFLNRWASRHACSDSNAAHSLEIAPLFRNPDDGGAALPPRGRSCFDAARWTRSAAFKSGEWNVLSPRTADSQDPRDLRRMRQDERIVSSYGQTLWRLMTLLEGGQGFATGMMSVGCEARNLRPVPD